MGKDVFCINVARMGFVLTAYPKDARLLFFHMSGIDMRVLNPKVFDPLHQRLGSERIQTERVKIYYKRQGYTDAGILAIVDEDAGKTFEYDLDQKAGLRWKSRRSVARGTHNPENGYIDVTGLFKVERKRFVLANQRLGARQKMASITCAGYGTDMSVYVDSGIDVEEILADDRQRVAGYIRDYVKKNPGTLVSVQINYSANDAKMDVDQDEALAEAVVGMLMRALNPRRKVPAGQIGKRMQAGVSEVKYLNNKKTLAEVPVYEPNSGKLLGKLNLKLWRGDLFRILVKGTEKMSDSRVSKRIVKHIVSLFEGLDL